MVILTSVLSTYKPPNRNHTFNEKKPYKPFTLFSIVWGITAQNSIKGVVVDGDSENPIEGVTVAIKNSTVRVLTNDKGVFLIKNLSDGNYILEISYPNYETQNFPVELSKNDIDFSTIYLYKDLTEEQDISIINITDDELNAMTDSQIILLVFYNHLEMCS